MAKPHTLFKDNLPGDTVKAWGKEYTLIELYTEDGIPLDLQSREDCIRRCQVCVLPRAFCAMVACSAEYRDDKRNIVFAKPMDNIGNDYE